MCILQEQVGLEADEVLLIVGNVLLELCGSAREIYEASEEVLKQVLSVSKLTELVNLRVGWDLRREYDKLKEQGIGFRWHLVGDGVLREELQKKAKDADVTDCFIFEGNQPNPYPYMKQADLFVHPSYVESFGIVVAEAMSLGIPCAVTKSLGPCEFIEDGINGILTEQNADSLTDSVIDILGNREKYEQIQHNTKCPPSFLPTHISALLEVFGEK